jgi:neutral ceramidase
MTLLSRLAVGAVPAFLVAACVGHEIKVASTPSPRPAAPEARTFRAGFGRVDITPPPGVGLSGNGPEGRKARGYRLRLYARALVVEDTAGSRLALVVVDLPHTSLLLQRRVGERLRQDGHNIGNDRLLLSATHTHSGPGNHYEAAHFNQENSEVAGYDPSLTDSLAARIARAIELAADRLRPARLAWGTTEVWGFTRIRSMTARQRNVPAPALLGTPPGGLSAAQMAIDPRLTMLRVDLHDSLTGKWLPAGAYSIFAVHGTGNSAETELYDADVHGIVERELERHVDSLRTREGGRPGKAVHVFANGTEGDTSPDWREDSRCPTPSMRPRDGPGGPFVVRTWDWIRVSPGAASECITSARRSIEEVGGGIGRQANALFDALKDSLTVDPVTWPVQRAFRTVDFRTEGDSLGACPEAYTGTSTVGGGPDARTRVYRSHVFGLFNTGFEEGEAAVDHNFSGCQGVKRLLLGRLVEHLFVTKGLPRYAQFGLYRVGPMLIAGVPAEVTTESGQRIERALRDSAAKSPALSGVRTRVVSIANGFIYYLATREEYTAQMYEGGSTLFGPGESEMVVRVESRMVRQLSGDTLGEPADTLVVDPGASKEVMKRSKRGSNTEPARLDALLCSDDTVKARFTRGRPGDWLPDGRPVLVFARDESLSSMVAADDHPSVEVWETSQKGGQVRWEARWTPRERGTWWVGLSDDSTQRQSITCGRAGP